MSNFSWIMHFHTSYKRKLLVHINEILSHKTESHGHIFLSLFKMHLAQADINIVNNRVISLECLQVIQSKTPLHWQSTWHNCNFCNSCIRTYYQSKMVKWQYPAKTSGDLVSISLLASLIIIGATHAVTVATNGTTHAVMGYKESDHLNGSVPNYLFSLPKRTDSSFLHMTVCVSHQDLL